MWIPQKNYSDSSKCALRQSYLSRVTNLLCNKPYVLATEAAVEVCILACSLVPDLALKSCAGAAHDSAEYLTLRQAYINTYAYTKAGFEPRTVFPRICLPRR
jgi:hypothetical protein